MFFRDEHRYELHNQMRSAHMQIQLKLNQMVVRGNGMRFRLTHQLDKFEPCFQSSKSQRVHPHKFQLVAVRHVHLM